MHTLENQDWELVKAFISKVLISNEVPILFVPKRNICNFVLLLGGCKTLMFFEGLPLSHLGATILLRGSTKMELIKIKQISSFFLFTCYNWRLEKSFLMDEFASPPNQKDEFFDESKENSPDLPMGKLSLSEEIIKSQIENKTKLELFSDGENDTEFFKSASESVNDLNIKPIKREGSRSQSEDKKMTPESISDFSDPLLSCNVEDDVFKVSNLEKFSVAELPFSNDFRKALDDTILCVSPYVVFSLPFLETEVGRKCKLRNFFPVEIFSSSQFGNTKKSKATKEIENINISNHKLSKIQFKSPHPFITARIRTNAENNDFQALLANFRACGGRLEHKRTFNIQTEDLYEKENNKLMDVEHSHLDALDPLSHQRLAVLFCSFSYFSNNAPAFCVKMYVINLHFSNI